MFVAETSAVAAPVTSTLSWKQISGPIEPFLAAVTSRLRQQVEAFDGGIGAYAEYALSGNGKQLRPALVAFGANAIGEIKDEHVTVAAIIEMVHLATLVHDDVMDEAEIRRGRASLAANWGNEIAVLLGDCLFAHSLKLAASFPTTEICRCVAGATNTVCAGEIVQNQQRKNFQLSRADYFRVLEMKTAELFALSCDMGGYLSGATASQRSMLRQYGLALGTAYQIYDDCLDLFGNEATVGKSLGTDIAKGKLTLPVLLYLENAPSKEKAMVQKSVESSEPHELEQVVKLVTQPEILAASVAVVEQYLEKARRMAASLPKANGLIELSDYLLQQAERLGADV